MVVQSSQTKRETLKASNLLLSLSLQNKKEKKKKNKKKKNSDGAFECSTCNQKFQSFQALGGHRTSHLRPKVRFNRLDLVIREKIKETKRHVCGLCGKEFLMGQALGGHMRLHKTSSLKEMEFDLNKPPLKDQVLYGEGFNGDAWSGESSVLLLKLFE